MASGGIQEISKPAAPTLDIIPTAAAIGRPVAARPEPLDLPVANVDQYTEWSHPVPVPDRLMMPDITGLYEQIATPGQERATVQISTAGRMVVGWFSPAVGTKTLRSWPASTVLDGERFESEQPGAFLVDPITHKLHAVISHEKDWVNRANPTQVLERLSSDKTMDSMPTGTFASLVVLDDQLVHINFDPDNHNEGDTFRRYSTVARPPYNRAMDSDGAFTYLVGTFLRPMGPTEMDWFVDTVCGEAAKDRIRDWRRASPNSFDRRNCRQDIFAAFRVPFWSHQRSAVVSRMRGALRTQVEVEGEETDSFAGWYALLAQEEADAPNKPARAATTGPNALLVELGVARQLGDGYAYRFSFGGARLPYSKPGVSASAALLGVRVKTASAKFDIDSLGRRVEESDYKPKILNRPAMEAELAKQDGRLMGALALDCGAGLKFEGSTTMSPSEMWNDVTMKNTITETFLPEELTFYSAQKVELVDFEHAHIRCFLLGGLKVQVHRQLPNVNFETTLFELHIIDRDVMMSAVRTKVLLNDPSMPAAVTVAATDKEGKEMITKEADKWYKFRFGLRIFEATIGLIQLFGRTGTIGSDFVRPLVWSPPPTIKIGQLANESFTTLFELDKPYLTGGFDVVNDARLRLEVKLATFRALLLRGSTVTVEGMTSPEGSFEHNARLSQARAEHVRQAVIDALGPGAATLKFGPPLASGETRARNEGGLEDPPDDVAARAEWLKGPQGHETSEWPKWRAVEVSVDGAVYFRTW
jgi:hypothetical protein